MEGDFKIGTFSQKYGKNIRDTGVVSLCVLPVSIFTLSKNNFLLYRFYIYHATCGDNNTLKCPKSFKHLWKASKCLFLIAHK